MPEPTRAGQGGAARAGGMPSVAQTRRPAFAGLSLQRSGVAGSGLLERLDVGADAALVTRGLVLVDQPARRVAVEDRHGGRVRGLGGRRVLRFQRLEDLLDGGAQHGALAGIAGVADDGLLGALLGGLDVGHGGLLESESVGRSVRNRREKGGGARKTRNYGPTSRSRQTRVTAGAGA